MVSRLAGVTFVIASTIVFAGCSSSSYSEAEGSESGPCYANGTCNAGLVCASSRCVRLDGGEVPDGSAVADAGVDARDAAACKSPNEPPVLTCDGANCATGGKCCVGVGCLAPAESCTSPAIACLSPSDCVGTDRCCAVAERSAGSTCPVVVTNIAKTECRTGACADTEVTLCYASGAAVCANGQSCVAGTLDGNPGGNRIVGVCR